MKYENSGSAQYKIFFDYDPDVIFIADIKGMILDANYLAVESYGYSREELLSMSISDLRARGEKAFTEKQLEQALIKRRIYETVHMRKDGSTFPVEISSRDRNEWQGHRTHGA